jgi:diguanylate cyclase (GGDEF)-like protein
MTRRVGADRVSSRVGTALAALLCLGLLVTGVGLTAAAGGPPLDVELPALVLPLLLLMAYVFTGQVSLDFEVRGNTHSVTLGQLPLALGVLLVTPWLHLAACLAAAVLSVVVRRQHLFKAGYNIGVAGFEVGTAAFVVSLAHSGGRPSASLWLALYAGLLLADGVGSLALSGVWRLLRMPLDAAQVVQPLGLGAVTSTAAAGLAVVTVSAAYTEPASVIIVLVLAGGLASAYRRHRLLRAQQVATQDLYEFVRDLGPVDAEASGVQDVLEQVRVLLNARRLDLLLPGRDRGWQQLTAQLDAPPQRRPAAAPGAHSRQRSLESGGAALHNDVMTTTLFGSGGMLGLLTAVDRLGDVRDFDLGDVRMLETVGSELATALERGRLLADLRRTATTDALTGLPSLVELTRQLDELLDLTDSHIVLATVAVDSFREVNDTLGHAVGDDLLLETTRRLQRSHPEALIGRIGGARFAVAVPSAGGDDVATLFGLGLRAHVEGEARIGPVGTQIRLSVGVVQAPVHGDEGQILLRRAETAMASAREAHGGPVAWAPAYEVRGQRRLAVVTALREAIATGAIGLAFQPKLDTRSGAVTGVEALARWTHPALGVVGPDEFIPLAEASGFIRTLTSTVLRQATTAARGWQRRAPDVGISVNISADTVLDPTFVTEVSSVLTSAGLPAHLLTLELTEGVVVADPELAVERLGELRALGVHISVDDFGTGYSSLTYLKGLPVDEVKIDKGFIAGVTTDPADQAVVRAVVDIAHTLGLRVVAEGVENAGQHEALASLGVDEVQGYLHARPMPATAVASWLRNRTHSDTS